MNFIDKNGVVWEEVYRDGLKELKRAPRMTDEEGFLITYKQDKVVRYEFSENEYIREAVIKEGINKIEECAFYNCEKLNYALIPGSAKEIGSKAFKNCINLEEVKIKNGVESIGNGAFSFCLSLKEMEIPKSVKNIGKDAFLGSGLQNIYVNDEETALKVIYSTPNQEFLQIHFKDRDNENVSHCYTILRNELGLNPNPYKKEKFVDGVLVKRQVYSYQKRSWNDQPLERKRRKNPEEKEKS